MKFFSLLLLISLKAQALSVKIGALAPEGTIWSKGLKELGLQVDQKTKGEVKFKFYFGGAQGDEDDVLRKVRLGQLQGGVFTGKTLSEVVGDFRVLEIPFTFMGDSARARRALGRLSGHLDKGFRQKGFVVLGFSEMGHVYLASKGPIEGLGDLKKKTLWLWQGDRLVASFLQELGAQGVPLSLPDVLTSLSTGIIDAVYAPALGLVALQWHTRVSHILELPLATSFGALIVSGKSFQNWPQAQEVLSLCRATMEKINALSWGQEKAALKALKDFGLRPTTLSREDQQELQAVRQRVVKKLLGVLFSEMAYQKLF